MRVLYVDFDGVLHHHDVRIYRRRGIVCAEPGHALFEWVPFLADMLDTRPDIRIVLSTSWVRVRDFDFTRRQLPASLQQRVIGATFHRRHHRRRDFEMRPRGVQIAEDAERRGLVDWIAIDDDADAWPTEHSHRLIQTDPELGLSDPVTRQRLAEALDRLQDVANLARPGHL